jgi:pyridoxal phosphate enzyme (YggS family)
MNTITANLTALHEKIARACVEKGRDPHDVNLVAVSKLQPPERIAQALAAGQRLFGENRVQEAKAHWADLRAPYPDLKLHLIGPLQTNKAGAAVALFDCIETVDRPSLADVLAKEMKKQGRNLPCFIQVNTGEEEQKGGVAPDGLPPLLDHCRKAGLAIRGLMCIPPVDEPPGPHFALLKKLAQRHGLADLSMGMSADFEQAIALGATYIRLGTALFGERGK